MRIILLASGSNGNCCYLELENDKYLIDCGISYRAIKERLEQYEIDIDDISNIIITHEHIDHVRALPMLLKHNPYINYYMTKGTFNGLKNDVRCLFNQGFVQFINQNEERDFLNYKLTFLRTHHDSNEAIGLLVESAEKKFVYITDTGYFEEKNIEKITNPDLLILESNYDVEVLFSSNRPYELKERINSNYGHLSNYDSAILASKVIGPKTKQVVYAHVSADCNFYGMPEIIIKSHQAIYDSLGLDYSNIEFYVGNRESVTGEFII